MDLPGRPVSYWIDSTDAPEHAALSGDARAEVAIVGGGIVGLTAALLLRRTGADVVVLDRSRILTGVTGHTTAKFTAGHGLLYQELKKKFGTEAIQRYAAANTAAMEHAPRTVTELAIDCDLARTGNYVYAESDVEVEDVEREISAMQLAGLPAAFVHEMSLPFAVRGGYHLGGQVRLHPRKYLLGVAAALVAEGGRLHEHTRAIHVEEDGARSIVRTDRGNVTADHVVVATNIPFLDRGFFFAKVHPYRSYTIAAVVDAADAPDGMFINAGSPTRSIRITPYGEGTALLTLNGDGHRTGSDEENGRHYLALRDFMRDRLGATDVRYRWSTQDYYSVDHLPYVGRLTRRTDRVHVATGFGGWGMTNGTLAAMLITDAIGGKGNEWAALFDAKRVKPRQSATQFVKENAAVARYLAGDRITRIAGSPSDLKPGEARVMRHNDRRVAAHRDDQGALHVVSATCTHLGCLVRWNDAERTWDCPCHGSRFDTSGALLQGPATRDLDRVSGVE